MITIPTLRAALSTSVSRTLVDYLTSLMLAESGGVYFPLDDSGAYARAVNPAVALGRNIVLNGAFDTDTVWTKQTGWTIAGGVAHSDGTELAKTISQAITGLVAGKSYEVTFTISNYVSGTVRPELGAGAGIARSANGTYTDTIVQGSTLAVAFRTSGESSFIGDIDNVSVKQVNIPASTSFTGAELLSDGDMEAATTAAWNVVQTAGTLTKETNDPHGGTRVLRIARASNNDPTYGQAVCTTGKTYRVTGWARSDGSAIPRVLRHSGSAIFVGTNSTSWQQFDAIFVADGANLYLRATTSTGTQYAEFDDLSVTEVNPFTGTVSGATVNQAVSGPIQKAMSFDGVNDVVNIYSADLNSVFNPDAGTLLVLAKVASASVWTDGVERRVVSLNPDGNNRIYLIKASSNVLVWEYRTGGVILQRTKTATPTDWIMLALTWDKPADQMKAYYNGVQDGATITGLGTWSANHASTFTNIGSYNTSGASVWNGLIAHPILFNRALTAAEILSIAQRAGVA